MIFRQKHYFAKFRGDVVNNFGAGHTADAVTHLPVGVSLRITWNYFQIVLLRPVAKIFYDFATRIVSYYKLETAVIDFTVSHISIEDIQDILLTSFRNF